MLILTVYNLFKGCLDVSRAPPLSNDKYLSVTVCVRLCECMTDHVR